MNGNIRWENIDPLNPPEEFIWRPIAHEELRQLRDNRLQGNRRQNFVQGRDNVFQPLLRDHVGDPYHVVPFDDPRHEHAMDSIPRLDGRTPPGSPPAVGVASTVQGMLNDWQNMFENPDLKDFTIKCGSASMKVHGLVLAARSPVFKAMLQHDTVENRNREVAIDDMEPDTLQAIIQHMYYSKVDLDNLESPKICQLAAAADKYGLIELKDFCFEYLFRDITLQNAGDLLVLVRRHPGPEKFRKKITDFCSANFSHLRKDPDFKEALKECLDEFFIPEEANDEND